MKRECYSKCSSSFFSLLFSFLSIDCRTKNHSTESVEKKRNTRHQKKHKKNIENGGIICVAVIITLLLIQ